MMERPRQAVMLAGGRGVRLRPLTDTRPKPMLEFHGRPFLSYLLELLREQGFERVLLLLGYRAEAVQAYCGDGNRWNLSIDYVVSDVEDDTGRRLQRALPQLEPAFLFLYCDNYWPMMFEAMWRRYIASGAEALLTVYDNRDRYSRDNVRVDEQGRIITYDKDRRMERLQGVEIGFGIFRREIVNRLPEENVSFERVVYPKLAAARTLQAFVTGHRYYSVNSHERLALTEQFLARRPAVILDRDGVLNARPPRAEYVRSWADWQWLPGARESLRLCKETGFRVIVVSNQAGIARGVMTEAALADIHDQMRREAQQAGGEIDAIYCCPHGWDDGCECRKPKPGMLFQAQRELHLDLSRTYVIGDDERDGQAAEAAGCPWLLVSPERPLLEIAKQVVHRGVEQETRMLAGTHG